MLTTTLKTTAFAAAVLVCASAATSAYAQEPNASAIDQTQLLNNINLVTDDTQENFVLDLTSKANGDLHQRFAKIDNDIFAPLSPFDRKTVETNTAIATANSREVFERLVISDAELEMSAKIANIEDPFAPRLPMSPFLMAFTIHQ